MDALAVKQACKFAKEHALKNGPIVSLHYDFPLIHITISLKSLFFHCGLNRSCYFFESNWKNSPTI